MNLSYIDYINQAPGLSIIKNVQSQLLACSPKMAKMLGFNSPNETFGITDFDLQCDAAKGADEFIKQDNLAFENGLNQAIDIYAYSGNSIKAIIHEKKPSMIKQTPL